MSCVLQISVHSFSQYITDFWFQVKARWHTTIRAAKGLLILFHCPKLLKDINVDVQARLWLEKAGLASHIFDGSSHGIGFPFLHCYEEVNYQREEWMLVTQCEGQLPSEIVLSLIFMHHPFNLLFFAENLRLMGNWLWFQLHPHWHTSRIWLKPYKTKLLATPHCVVQGIIWRPRLLASFEGITFVISTISLCISFWVQVEAFIVYRADLAPHNIEVCRLLLPFIYYIGCQWDWCVCVFKKKLLYRLKLVLESVRTHLCGDID